MENCQHDKINPAAGSNALLFEDIEFTGVHDRSYVIRSGEPIHLHSVDSQIYRCTEVPGGEIYAARVLLTVRPDAAPNVRKEYLRAMEFLYRRSQEADSYLLPLLEYGTVHIGGYSYYVEICPYCPEGDMGLKQGSFSCQELRHVTVPAVNEALCQLHSAGFIHRDVKPAHLYRHNGRIVLGGFSMICGLGLDGTALDEGFSGTLGYAAPEQMDRAAEIKSDYYALGQTLWTLYTGQMMYWDVLQEYREATTSKQRKMVRKAMNDRTRIAMQEDTEEKTFLRILILGLLQNNTGSRFGYSEVSRWVTGDKAVAKQIPDYDSTDIFGKCLRWKHYVCWDVAQLHNCLAENWEEGRNLLYIGYLKAFFAEHHRGLAQKLDEILLEHPASGTDFQRDVGFGKLLLAMSGNRMLCWHGQRFHTLEDVRRYLLSEQGSQAGVVITPLLRSELPLMWYDAYLSLQEQPIDRSRMELVHELAASYPALSIELAKYSFAPSKQDISCRGCADLDALIVQCLQEKAGMICHGYEWMRDPQFLAFLIVLGYEEQARSLLKQAGDENSTELAEIMYSVLEELAEGEETQQIVRQHYASFGPQAHLNWWHQHLDLYHFRSEKAAELKKELLQLKIEPTAPLEQQRKQLETLRDLCMQFKVMFFNNWFLEEMGLRDESAQITSDHPEAFWHYSLLHMEVPLGYVAHLELLGGEKDA